MFTTADPADVERVADIDLLGVWRTFRATVPHVPSSGYLLAVASMASFIHSPLHSAYVAAKAGVWAMADSIRLEFRPSGASPAYFQKNVDIVVTSFATTAAGRIVLTPAS